MADKKYFWLKLKEDFFADIRMKRLRKISVGGTYTIVYLKLLLLSLRDEGKLYFEKVDETFIKELSLMLDETEDDIALTLHYLERVGLLEVVTEDEYFLTELPNLIGTETDWAAKKRRYREQRKLLSDRTMSSTCLPDVRQEVEKDIDIELEKDGEMEKDNVPINFHGEYQNVRLSDEEYQKLKDKLQNHTDIMIEKLSRYIKSSGKDYQDHYVTILNWYEQDKDKLSKKGKNKSYTTQDYDKGEYL
ncbi:phage replisome organizer N-terminal domain-containing protein [Dialister invisus]|uniref:phage replisome organizer N-terminal domain-containing protein n=1 Tax=Dialister invisus TaxID=218538 RepID=UPI00307B4057